MAVGKNITEAEKKRIIKLHNEGMRYSDIACKLSLSKSSVYNICRDENYKVHHRTAVFSYETSKKLNQAINRDDIEKMIAETYIGRPVVIRSKCYESDGIRATGMVGILQKKGRVCGIYKDFFNIIMTVGGYQTSINWVEMLCRHADYEIVFEE